MQEGALEALARTYFSIYSNFNLIGTFVYVDLSFRPL